MARKVAVHLLDDIDGGQADETLKFGLDGVNYEIDLSAKHADELRAALAKFILSARRVGRGGVTATRPGRVRTAPTRTDRAQNQAIREWARRKKIQLADRGRIPRAIAEQFEAEAGRR
jgi:Lsr2